MVIIYAIALGQTRKPGTSLNQDLFNIPTERISDTRVLLTMLGGKIVYDSGKVGGEAVTLTTSVSPSEISGL